MVEPRRDRPEWVDMGGIQRLAERALRTTTAHPDEYWRDPARPVIARHWTLADLDWHRRRQWSADGVEREETDHQFTRFALLPDGRLVRALCWRSETRSSDLDDGAVRAGPWQGEVRVLTSRDVHTLDQRTATTTPDEHGRTLTWGTQPTGEMALPWPGAGIEHLLKVLGA